MLYSQLAEGEFVSAAAAGEPKDFNYEYVEQLGYQLADENDPDRRDRGLGYLRIAARGLPDRGPGIFKKLADVSEKLGDNKTARGYTRSRSAASGTSTSGRNTREGPARGLFRRSSASSPRSPRPTATRSEAEADAADRPGGAAATSREGRRGQPLLRGRRSTCLREYLTGGGRVGHGGVPQASLSFMARCATRSERGTVSNVAAASQYERHRPRTSQREARQLLLLRARSRGGAPRQENIGSWFDVGYCVRKAMSVLNSKDADADLLDWATHLTRLAKVMEPASNRVRLVEGPVPLPARRERSAGLTILEERARRGAGVRRRGGGVVQRDPATGPVVPRRAEPPGPGAAGVHGLQGVSQERGGHAVPDRPVLRGDGRHRERGEVLQRGAGLRGAPANA